MNIQSKTPATAEEFLRWNEGREGKREFVGGRVVELMINVTQAHFWLSARLQQQLAAQLGLDDYIVGSADFGVRCGGHVRYPDVLVMRAGANAKALSTDSPLLIAEILSASSMADDFGRKKDDYLAIASLQHYVILSQDETALWLWTREGGDFQGPELFREPSEPVLLPALGLTLDLQALYRGISA